MKLRYLIKEELTFRCVNALLGVVAVAAAVVCVLGSMVLLAVFDQRTDTMIAAKEAALAQQMTEMEEDYRKLTNRMGFNVLILPASQDLGDFYAESYAQTFMPESYAKQLADAQDVVTIRHLLPILQQKVLWPEAQRQVLLIGARGEMPLQHRPNKKPLLQKVPPGTITVGYELHRSRQLEVGDKLQFMHREFVVQALQPERGTIDDITLWIDLDEAQALLEREDQISGIMALECSCALADIAKVRAELARVLPETQAVELAGKALARAEARWTAAHNAEAAIERERAGRAELRRTRAELAGLLLPLVVAVCALGIGLLAWDNVRRRRFEIGLLAAIGLAPAEILFVFLGKAAVIGVFGALLGAAAGGLAGLHYGNVAAAFSTAGILCLLAAPALAILASWLPALVAARQHPAKVLAEE